LQGETRERPKRGKKTEERKKSKKLNRPSHRPHEGGYREIKLGENAEAEEGEAKERTNGRLAPPEASASLRHGGKK